GQLKRYPLAFGKRFAERHSLFSVTRAHLDTALGDSQRARAVFQSTDAEPLLRQFEAFALFTNEVFRAHLEIIEDDLAALLAPHRFVLRRDFEPGRFHF